MEVLTPSRKLPASQNREVSAADLCWNVTRQPIVSEQQRVWCWNENNLVNTIHNVTIHLRKEVSPPNSDGSTPEKEL